MAQKERKPAVIPPQKKKEVFDWLSEVFKGGATARNKKMQMMKNYITKYGIDSFLDAHILFSSNFSDDRVSDDPEHYNKIKQKTKDIIEQHKIDTFLRMLLDSKLRHEPEIFIPDPELYPSLKKKLEELPGIMYFKERLEVSLIEDQKNPEYPRVRIEFPLSDNIKDYYMIVGIYTEYFKEFESPRLFIEYLVDEYGNGRTYKELADELNTALEKYFSGEETDLDCFGLKKFIKYKNMTAENYALYTAERISSVVRNYHDQRKR